MNHTLVAIAAVALFACSKEQATPSSPAPTPAPEPVVSTTPSATPAPTATGRAPKKEGEMCGGFAGFRCEEGLDCTVTPPIYPDKAGVCQKKK